MYSIDMMFYKYNWERSGVILPSNLSKTAQGALLVFISAFMYATLPIFTKLAYRYGLSPSVAIFYRYFLAFIILSVYLGLKKERVLLPSVKVFSQGLFLIAGSVFYFYSLQYIAASTGSIIFFTHPIIVAVLAVLIYKEKINAPLAAGLLLAMLGIILVSGVLGSSANVTTAGVLLAGISSICYACFALLGQNNITQASPLALTANFALLGTLIIPVIFFRSFDFIVTLTFVQFMICLAMALFNTVLSISLYLKGMQKIGASRAALISSLEPVLTVFLAMLILHEALSPLEIFGAILVLVSLYLAIISHRPGPQEEAAAALPGK